jgi:large subunit ribosomal protein L21
MFAVIQTGGKQYTVHPGDTVEVELLPFAPDTVVDLDQVLLVATDSETLVGAPLVEGAVVKATVARQGRGKKIIVFKYRSKKRYRRKTGHRQNYTYLTIDEVVVNGASYKAEEQPLEEEQAVDEAEPGMEETEEAEETTA